MSSTPAEPVPGAAAPEEPALEGPATGQPATGTPAGNTPAGGAPAGGAPAGVEAARGGTTPEGRSPFEPVGVTFNPVSEGLITARVVVLLISFLVPVAGTVVLAALLGGWVWVAPVAVLAVLVWLLWLIPRQVRAIGYAEADDDLLIRTGIVFRSLTVVPYGRMQFVDVNAGPLDRRFGVAQVRLHTAAAQTDATIPGLPPAEAARLRDRLTARGEARLAGL